MKRRQPYNPAQKSKQDLRGHLGVANEYRQAHSKSGFETEQIADGRFSSRERAMLTHPQLLAELYNNVMRKYAESGQPVPERIHIKMTPSDRATAPYRGILWAYLRTRAEVVTGSIKIADYEGAPSARDLHRLPLNQTQFSARRFYAWVREQPGLACVTDFLDRVVLQLNLAKAEDGEIVLSKAELGRELIDADNARDCKNASDGALVMCCRVLSETARDFLVLERRYQEQARRASQARIA
jgi:hypothetical protein